jgi:hypothetical protein
MHGKDTPGARKVNGPDVDISAIAKLALGVAETLVPARLPNGKREGDEWVALNPRRNDSSPGSFKINLKTGAWADFASGDKGGDLVSVWAHLDGANQFDAARKLAADIGEPIPAAKSAGLTLEQYAKAKGLDLDTLRGLGLETIPDPWGRKRPVLSIPYRRRDGSILRNRIRIALAKPADGSPRMFWDKDKAAGMCLYGLEQLPTSGCPLFLVEGESDCHTLWAQGWDVVGVPAAANYSPARDDKELEGFDVIALIENDEGGRTLLSRLLKSRLRIRAVVFEDASGCKDASELFLKDKAAFGDVMRSVIDTAPTLGELLKRHPELVATKEKKGAAADAAPEPERAKLPPGFRYARDGSVEYMAGNDEDDEEEPVWKKLCSPIEVLAETRDIEGTGWGLLLRVKTREGYWQTRAFSRFMALTQGDEFIATLAHLGLRFDDTSAVRKKLKLLFSRFETDILARLATKVGWHGDNMFVLPDEAFGKHSDDMVIFSPDKPIAHHYALKGTVEGWRSEVAARSVGNSRLAFAASAAFAGPLLDLLKIEGGGFHLRGGSSIGKTSSLFVAGSVWGGNDNSDIGFAYTWRGTDNGIESKAVIHNGTLLMLDELHLVHGEIASRIVYTLANGQGKSRADQKGGARQSAEWRILFLSTGEMSLAAKLAEAGLKTMAGQETRFIDLEADAGVGLGTFEVLHGFADGASFSKAIKAACKTRNVSTTLRQPVC